MFTNVHCVALKLSLCTLKLAGYRRQSEIRLGTSDCLYGKSLVMELLLKIPTKVNIYYYCKRVPWLILKLSQSRSGADVTIGQKTTKLAVQLYTSLENSRAVLAPS